MHPKSNLISLRSLVWQINRKNNLRKALKDFYWNKLNRLHCVNEKTQFQTERIQKQIHKAFRNRIKTELRVHPKSAQKSWMQLRRRKFKNSKTIESRDNTKNNWEKFDNFKSKKSFKNKNSNGKSKNNRKKTNKNVKNKSSNKRKSNNKNNKKHINRSKNKNFKNIERNKRKNNKLKSKEEDHNGKNSSKRKSKKWINLR